MPVEIPATPSGERFVTVNVGPDIFIFRTYFAEGQDRHWLLDILDGQSNPLVSGINLVPGVDNLLKGRGDTLQGYQLYLSLIEGSEKDLEALGNTMALIWFNPGEENPAQPGDPLDLIGASW